MSSAAEKLLNDGPSSKPFQGNTSEPEPSPSCSTSIVDSAATKKAKLHALLNRKRKVETIDDDVQVIGEVKKKQTPTEETTLKKCDASEKAKAKILLEAKRAKERAERHGPQGWLRPPSLNTNKRFLANTLKATVSRTEQAKGRDLGGGQ